jgi:branched-chain amino acid transport system permease protein
MLHFLQIIVAGLLQGCIYALLAIGFSLIYRVTSTVNLAQGAFCIFGALVASSCETMFGFSPLLAFAIGVSTTGLLATLLGVTIFVPGLEKLPPGSMFILTVGLLTSLQGLSIIVWGSQAYTLTSFSGESPINVLGLRIPPQGLWLFATTALITGALAYLLAGTQIGRAFRACAENPSAARLMGIGVRRMQLLSVVLAATIGAAGGIVMGPMTSFQFDTGGMYTIFGFIAAAIGGIGAPLGAVVGGLCLGIATQLAAAYVSTLFSNALALVLLIAILLWRPSGLFSSGPARREDVRESGTIQRAVVRLGAARGAILAGLGAFVFLVLVPIGFGSSGLMSSVNITAIMFLAVIGLDVLMGFAGLASLGQGAFMAIGGYTASVLAVQFDVAPILGVVAGAALSLVCALVLAVGTIRLRGLHLAIATLAFGLLVDSITVGLEDLTGGPSGLVGIPSFSIGGFSFDTPLRNYYLTAGVIVVVLILLTAGIRGGFGRALLAIRADALAASALGIKVRNYRIAAFCISAVLGSLAGSLYAFYFHFLSPDMVGTPLSLQMLSMVMIGGEGTLIGPLFGAALLTIVPTLFQPLALYKTLGSGVLLIFVSLYLPSGLFGSAISWMDRIGRPGAALGQVRRSAS